MKHYISLVIFCLLLSLSSNVFGQIGKFLKDKAKDLGSKENLEKLRDEVGDKLDEARSEIDASSFSYAISVNDHADFVGTDNLKDQSVKWLTNINNSDDATEAEKARSMLDVAELLYAKRYYNEAEKTFISARAKYELNKLTDDINYYRAISTTGLLYSTMGRYSLSEELTREALEKRKEALGAKHLGYAASLNNLAVLQKETGKYNEAEFNIKEAVTVLEGLSEEDKMPLAIALNNQAMLYQDMGRYDQAKKILEEAIAISSNLQNEKSSNHQKFLTNKALLLQEMKDYNAAEQLFQELIKTKKRRFGASSPDYAHMLNNLAALYMEMGKYDEVESLLKEAKGIYEKQFGKNHRLYAKAISDLGNFYRFQSKYQQAKPLLEEAFETRKNELGEQHPEYAESVEDLAILHWKMSEIGEASKLYTDALNLSLAFINSYFPPMSEAEKTKYWDKLRPRFERFYAFASDVNESSPHLMKNVYDYHIATKGLLLSASNKIKQEILNSGNESLIEQYVQWLDQKESLAQFYTYSKEELIEQNVNLDSLEKATNNTERQLSEKSEVFSEAYNLKQVRFEDVKSILKDGEVAIEILRIRKFKNTLVNDPSYLVLILSPNKDLPESILMQNGEQLETRYFKYYNNAIHQKIADEYSYEQYWSPFSSYVAGNKTLYISLDGIYNQINVNTLLTPSRSYIIDQFDIVLVGNTKDLLNNRKVSSVSKTAYITGNPDFGGNAVSSLPGTKIELDKIGKLLSGKGYKFTKNMSANATEKAIKSVNNPRLLHIATHGYFLEDNQLNANKVFGVSAESAKNNPLLRAGLLFNGASNTINQEGNSSLENNDNGILTAYEAMNLSLNKTELVVLSACETAVGDVKAGEGVYGLQRAFLSAGAQALIMSLWKVDDTATQELMAEFYKVWLTNGNRRSAFKRAQLTLKSKYNQPYYWGAFVLVGQ